MASIALTYPGRLKVGMIQAPLLADISPSQSNIFGVAAWLDVRCNSGLGAPISVGRSAMTFLRTIQSLLAHETAWFQPGSLAGRKGGFQLPADGLVP